LGDYLGEIHPFWGPQWVIPSDWSARLFTESPWEAPPVTSLPPDPLDTSFEPLGSPTRLSSKIPRCQLCLSATVMLKSGQGSEGEPCLMLMSLEPVYSRSELPWLLSSSRYAMIKYIRKLVVVIADHTFLKTSTVFPHT
jgi:hypothetical protein